MQFSQLAFGEFASKTVGFVTVLYVARVLGAEGFGMYGFVTALSGYVILFSNFGIEQYSAQKLSASHSPNIPQIISTVISTRFLLSCLFVVPFAVFGFFYADTRSEILLFLFQSIFILAFSLNLQFYFVTAKKLKVLSFIRISISIGVLAGSLVLIRNPQDLPLVTLISGICTLCVFVSGVIYVLGKFEPGILLTKWYEMKDLLVNAAPLGISALMIQIYHSIDIVFLGFTNPGMELGYYTGAYRIINVLTTIPGLFYLVFLPDLSRITSGYFSSIHTKRYIILLVSVGMFITIGSAIFSEQIISILLGNEYLPARTVFIILVFNVLLVFINVSLAQLFIAWNRHKKYMVIVTLGAAANIIGNLFLIPSYGIIGAAIATVLAEVAVLVSAVWFHYRLHGLFVSMKANA